MLIIKSSDFEFNIDNKKEHAIYLEKYIPDRDGQPQTDEPKRKLFNYNANCGHIIFETEYKRYILEAVRDPDYWILEILNYIELHRNEKNIIIDLFELQEDSNGALNDFQFFGCRTESI